MCVLGDVCNMQSWAETMKKKTIPKAIMVIFEWNKTITLLLWAFFNLDECDSWQKAQEKTFIAAK